MIMSNQLEDSDIWEDVIGVATEHQRIYRGKGQSKISY